MKKGQRCPVCGSLHIKEATNSNNAEKKESAVSQEKTKQVKQNWKCFDCYRIFEKPDDTM